MGTKENSNGNPLIITGDWTKESNKLKGRYSQLTDSDLEYEPGKEIEMVDRVATKLNKQRSEAIDIIKKVQLQIV